MGFLAGIIGVIAFALNDLFYRALALNGNIWLIMSATNGALLIVATLWLLYIKQGFIPRPFWGWPLILCLAKIANSVCALMTFHYLPVALAYMLLFSDGIWVAVIDGVIKKNFAKRYLGSLVLAFIGVLMVFYKGDIKIGWGIPWGVSLAVVCALNIIIARKLNGQSSFKLSFVGGLTSLLFGLVGVLFTHANLQPILHSFDWKWLALAMLSVTGSVTSLYAAQKMQSVRYALLCYLQIPIAVVLAWALLHEPLTPRIGLGLVLITVGSLIAQLRGTLHPKVKVPQVKQA